MEGPKSALQRVAADTGIPVSTYSWRHKVTTVLRKSKVPEDQVAVFLGHKRPDLRTTGRYGEFDPDYLKEAAGALETWFWRIVKLARQLAQEKAANTRDTPDRRRTRTKIAA
jgi:integrase